MGVKNINWEHIRLTDEPEAWDFQLNDDPGRFGMGNTRVDLADALKAELIASVGIATPFASPFLRTRYIHFDSIACNAWQNQPIEEPIDVGYYTLHVPSFLRYIIQESGASVAI